MLFFCIILMRALNSNNLKLFVLAFLMPHEFEPFPLKKVGADHKRAYEIMKQYRDINWICMAPPEIVNLPYTGTCQVLFIVLHFCYEKHLH